ncbi:MAG TPA: glycosyltransferase, partial [Candidatus Omnitrophota bacterium]|nr:glycosyltransferase [Candidatus Omnitrophota bacterium]
GIFFINPHKRYNSSPIKFGEYLACGLPVVVISGVGDTDTICSNERVGVVISSFAHEELSRAAEELLSMTNDASSLKARCRKAAERFFSLENGIKAYGDIYCSLSERR